MKLEVPNLIQETFDLLSQVPKGKVTTFRKIADALGDAIASRAVGQIIAEFAPREDLPAHRVIYSDGKITRGEEGRLQRSERLAEEGIPIDGWKIQHFQNHLWDNFKTRYPLKRLKNQQREIAKLVKTECIATRYETAGGLDLSYESPWYGVGAYVQMDMDSNSILQVITRRQEIIFPYIPTYLTYRELPVQLALLEKAHAKRQLPDVIFVDGSGILHPRYVGIASQLGVMLNIPTIGVIKKLLYGSVPIRGMRKGEVRKIIDPEDARVIGAAIKTRDRAEPIYVSVGHGIDLKTAIELVLKLSKHKLPEPIHRAHLASKEAAQDSTMQLKQRAFDL